MLGQLLARSTHRTYLIKRGGVWGCEGEGKNDGEAVEEER
jgi:hypothetical protein